MTSFEEPLLKLDEIQGNILPGFKKDNQYFFFFRVADAVAARPWLVGLGERLATARQVFKAHELWKDMRRQRGHEPKDLALMLRNAAFTYGGLSKLVPAADLGQFDDDAFRLGLDQRSSLLGDPTDPADPGAPASWLFGGSAEKSVDLLVIMASDDAEWLEQEGQELVAVAARNGLTLVHQDRGKVRPGAMAGHEPFGFKDGISEPSVRGRWPDQDRFVAERTLPPDPAFDPIRDAFAAPGSPLISPGHFLFGYQRQLARDPRHLIDGPLGPPWAANGSFVVYRRLRQDTAGFAAFLEDQTKKLAGAHPGLTVDRLGALLVGRWKSGTPMARSPSSDIGIVGDAANYFNFTETTKIPLPGDAAPLNPADSAGAVCPLGAHIRKVNPRDDTTNLGTKSTTLPRTILRRGIPFDETASAPGDEGLLFVAYQSSIDEQFEFLMRDWVNRTDHPVNCDSYDPVLAAAPGHGFKILFGNGKETFQFPSRFVRPTGGAYLFAPPISFFASLARN